MPNASNLDGLGVGGKQRSVTTLNIPYLIKSHEKLMDFYHMKGMISKSKPEQFRLFSLRDKHFQIATKLSKEYDERI
jgi:hypothetical protein